VSVRWNTCIYEGINYEVLFSLIVQEKKENRDDIVGSLEYCEVEYRDYLKAVCRAKFHDTQIWYKDVWFYSYCCF